MAIIKSFDAIKDLVPNGDENQFYLNWITEVPINTRSKVVAYAIVIDNKRSQLVTCYRVRFTLFSYETSNYLFINEFDSDSSNTTRYASMKGKAGFPPKKEEWEFKTDEVGLYIDCGSRQRERVYFATDESDAQTVVNLLGVKPKRKLTVVTETVYV